LLWRGEAPRICPSQGRSCKAAIILALSGLILEPAVDAGSRLKTHAESSRSAVLAKAGTHAKYMQNLRFLLPWITAFAGMTVWNPRHTSFTRTVKEHPPATRCFARHIRVEPVLAARFGLIHRQYRRRHSRTSLAQDEQP
jgi:type IV secretory pathway TrbD component